jgi:hypothetical protein
MRFLKYAIFVLLTGAILGAAFWVSFGESVGKSEAKFATSAHKFDTSRPLTVVVRGWLWDPLSRKGTPPLVVFPEQLNSHLRSEHGLTTEVVQWDWSRLPSDVFTARDELRRYAKSAADRAGGSGRCVNFLGHSAGAALVYSIAADGAPMGYLGTLGLPTSGRGKPASVVTWANFYTTTHREDVAGKVWGSGMKADVNVDLKMSHRDFWESDEVAKVTADGIAQAWSSCRN